MGFNILVTDVDNLGGFLTSYQSTVGDQLAAVNDAAVVVSGLTDFQGDTATAVKAYWGEAHTITVAALNEAMTDLVVRYALYADGYGSDAIDGARDAKLDQETIDESSQDMESVLPDVESRRTRISSALESISDILPLAEPDTNGITDSLEDASLIASQLSQRVAEHEAAHVGSAREVSGLISAVEAVLGDLETRYSSGNGYSSNDFASSQAFTDLSAAYMAVAGHIRENADAATDIYQRIGERQQERYEEWERQQAEEREKRGYAEMLAGGALLIVGVAVCVGSGGAAAPIVLGAATAVFGASDMVEGAQDVYYGSRGDMASVTFNPLRDTVFMGNQQIYSLAEMTVSTLACLSVPVTAAISTAPPGASAFAVGGRALAMGGARMAGGIAVTQYVIDPTIAALAGGGENGRIAVGLVNLGLTVYAARSGAFSTERAIAVERQRLQTEIPEIESQTGLEGEHVRVASEHKAITDGPYIKDGKPHGRPRLSGKAKYEFEKTVYENQVDADGMLRDPNTGEIIDWKPGEPRSGVADFGHVPGEEYRRGFSKYASGEWSLSQLKEHEFNPNNFQIERPSPNRSGLYEAGGE